MQEESTDLIKELKRRAWQTSGARFAAHRRLSRKHIWSTWAVAVLSIYVIAGSLFGSFVSQSPDQRNIVNVGLVVTSILVLVLSLIESSMAYPLRAERLHACAVELTGLELEGIEVAALHPSLEREGRVTQLRRRFEAIKKACPENHHVIDWEMFQAGHPKHFKIGLLKVIRIRVENEIATVGWYVLAMITPLVPIVLFLGSVHGGTAVTVP